MAHSAGDCERAERFLKAADKLGFWIEMRGDIHVLQWANDGGCRPAEPTEIAMWKEITGTEGGAERG